MIFAIVFMACLAAAHAQKCTCAKKPPLDQAFCRARFVTHATVTKVDKSEYGVTYSLEHKEVYWPKNLDLPKKVFTPIPEYCGLAEDLAEGRDYLIGGKCVTHGSFDITYFS
ncbi:hypothetical protein Y032_0009g578 [Ancylostoma ceylanicum]|uniref:NTR domain-containing protein n=1 Tax=Ancylostoma ceylanicum TaxID=53326 RepID=A0A016VIF4_9BILA|nr:hypothetical protein Y032_0009g578 [Ancylostoma ceylanicum]